MFFFLIQTEQGDIFKATLESDDDVVRPQAAIAQRDRCLLCFMSCDLISQVTEIRIKYFDTVPLASSMCVLKTGFLFCASEFSNQ